MDPNMLLFYFFLFLSSSSTNFNVDAQSRCTHQNEISALLQFKNSFQIDCTYWLWSYPKTSSWNDSKSFLNGDVEWDGVECDPVFGHVIGLDLSESCLRGSINSTTSSNIFSCLVHLEHLNLAYNNFQGSSIQLDSFSRLTYLNLSYSHSIFDTLKISKLSKLISLDLSYNWGFELNLKSLIENLDKLEQLHLSYIDINSKIPKWLFTNMSSLRSLQLDRCGLYGKFPQGIFQLPNLQHLNIEGNPSLEGHLPIDFNSSNPPLLESLALGETNFTGVIPVSIENLVQLRELLLYGCKFSGSIPSLANLTNLSVLDLSRNSLIGQIPSVLSTQLTYLRLSDNHLSGKIPMGLVNLTKLDTLKLGNNKLHGPLPIGNLSNIKWLYVQNNMLSGTLELDMLLGFRKLVSLMLSSNNLTLIQQRNGTTTSTLPRFYRLGLSSCRLSKFPEIPQHQDRLIYLDLSSNNIQGPIPKWMGSIRTCDYMDLSHNFITSLDHPHLFLPLLNLTYLDISYNKLKGSVPIPSPSVVVYRASNNELTGEITQLICNSTLFEVLDLSSNHLSGELDPHCFDKNPFRVLNLRNNSFHGKIPNFCKDGTYSRILRMIDLSSNQFQGKIPRSLTNCVELEFLNVGSNLINDTFPSWMGSLLELKVLILKDNGLTGSMETMTKIRSGYWFPKLIIIDLSQNSLSGNLTSCEFDQWVAMKMTQVFRNPSYIGLSLFSFYSAIYDYSVTMYDKGTNTEFSKILDALITIDLSSNRLEGEIPSTLGDLRGLHFLNLSNNHLYGGILSSLGALTELEAMDLSCNGLSGQIPQQLSNLDFLSYFDVSHNNLTGLIPQGRHFDTFPNSSYLDNPGLCGAPLSRECGRSGQEAKQPQESVDDFWESVNAKIVWMVVSIGFGGELVVGVAIENMFDWRMLIRSWKRRN